jgi:hypothetical protein
MSSCRHTNLELLSTRKITLRCRQCHLTIDAAQLEDGCCPECLERSGRRHDDFEKIAHPDGGATYRCEGCGAIVKS